MDTLFIPNENDFRRWIREAVKESVMDYLKQKRRHPFIDPETDRVAEK